MLRQRGSTRACDGVQGVVGVLERLEHGPDQRSGNFLPQVQDREGKDGNT